MAQRYKLSYFPLRAFGEPIRFLLSYMAAEFEDNRINVNDWPKLKPCECFLVCPFGKLPFLEIDGVTVCQSVAITRYLGRKAGISGDNEWEDLLIDMAVDVFSDFMKEVTSTLREKDPFVKAEKDKVLDKEIIPFYLENLDNLVKSNGGYLANNKLSWGDLYFASVMEFFQTRIEMNLKEYTYLNRLNKKVFDIPNIKRWVKNRPPDKR